MLTDSSQVEEAASAAPFLTVIIPTHYRPNSVDRVLTGLEQQTVPANSFEVIVILDGACPDTEAVLRKHRGRLRLRWYTQPATGAPAARNRGVAEARSKVLLFLDDDVIPAPELVETHIRCHRAETDVMVFGSFFKSPQSPEPLVEEAFDWSDIHRQMCNAPGYTPRPKDATNRNLSAHREPLLRMGGRDATFVGFGGSDDAELASRWVQQGGRLHFEPTALAYHYWTKSWADHLRDRRENGRGDCYFARKHPNSRAELHISRFLRGSWGRRLLTRIVAYTPECCFTATERLVKRFGSNLDPRFGRTVFRWLIVLTGAMFYVHGYFEEDKQPRYSSKKGLEAAEQTPHGNGGF